MFGKNNSPQEITVSNKTIFRIIGIIFAVLIFVQLIDVLRHPLTMIFVSFFLALALNPAVTWVANRLKSNSRMTATTISYIAVITLLIALITLLVPPLVRQTTDFIDNAPATLRDLETSEGFVGDTVRRFDLGNQVEEFANSWSSSIDTAPVVSTANRVVANVFSIITVLILTFMMLIEGPKWLRFIWSRYPDDKREYARDIANRMYRVVTNYVNGQVLVSAIGAMFAIVALFITTTLFGVTSINPIALGGIVFLFNLIPYIGVFISSTIVILFSLFASVPLALIMLAFFIIYQQIENASIQPYIQSRGLELTPLLVFIAAIIGVRLSGILGALIAIPVAGCIRIVVEDYLIRNTSYKARVKKDKKI